MSHLPEYDDEEHELSRLLDKRRAVVDERADLQAIQDALLREQAAPDNDDLASAELVFAKWRLIHKYIHTRPFRLTGGKKRSDQWREVAALYAPLEQPELNEWIALQIEVAENLEAGRSDLRIRRDGPCYLIVLEYAGNRKRTALAILHWARKEAEALGR